MKKLFRKQEAVILIIMGTLAILIVVNDKNNNSMTSGTQQDPDKNLPLKQTHRPLHMWWKRNSCSLNAMNNNLPGFSDLPDHIKDFLRYRHCKHFQILQDIPNKCVSPEQSKEIFLLLVIKSSPENYERREVIRKTWGQERTYEGVQVHRLFISGVNSNRMSAKKSNQIIQLENQQYQDILQWDFHDTFFNLSLKQVLFFKWKEKNCPGVKFLLNGDDDVFVNTENVVHYLKGFRSDRHLFVGTLIMNVGPIRAKWSKYYVPEQVTTLNSYPPYCGGGGFLMSDFTAKAIYNASLNLMLFPIDDVYIGMCLQKAGLFPSSHMGIRTAGVHAPSENTDTFDPCFYQELLLVHRFAPYEMVLMWQAIHDATLKCGASAPK
ncbi:N-acetyllactosaminide beta-1,3-N-acetylglucosaminyltransferase 3-like [Protopterus annectens]|uniref:N-acetyllactosaminide beta-1,3-N-acetylglucosaminyltransferase 3-like n=1 Tax=Protopterus annectens TaxID=7888 RepID=UPI001CFAAA16|nr:N-acetyllactosaminide beta-1,3-N-acetylglucosaminyltransferase 3-like [Protopterus annectens]